MSNKIKFTKSSGNIYEDMGFADAKERLVKAELALKINQLIEDRQLRQVEAAKVLGINQPKISAIANGRLNDFSIERLIGFLNRLDQDVEIVVHAKPKRARRSASFTATFDEPCKPKDMRHRFTREGVKLAKNKKDDI